MYGPQTGADPGGGGGNGVLGVRISVVGTQNFRKRENVACVRTNESYFST